MVLIGLRMKTKTMFGLDKDNSDKNQKNENELEHYDVVA